MLHAYMVQRFSPSPPPPRLSPLPPPTPDLGSGLMPLDAPNVHGGTAGRNGRNWFVERPEVIGGTAEVVERPEVTGGATGHGWGNDRKRLWKWVELTGGTAGGDWGNGRR
jgi:hypothetical protein